MDPSACLISGRLRHVEDSEQTPDLVDLHLHNSAKTQNAVPLHVVLTSAHLDLAALT